MVCVSRSADEPHFAIHYQQLAVSAIVQARERMPVQWVIPLYPATRLAQFPEVTVPGGEAADGVDDHVHLHPGSRPLRHGLDKAPCQLTALEDVRFQVHAALGLRDGL
jgi:hypothetical protein